MAETPTPYLVYVTVNGDKPVLDLACIPTELLLPLQNSIPTEIWRRSERQTFKADHDAMGATIEPRQMKLNFKR